MNDLMKAQVLVRPGVLELKEIPVPQISDDEVLIKVRKSSICNGSDPAILSGESDYPMPVVFGHEALGQIVECGSNVMRFKVGDRVSWWFTMGAFAQYAAVNPSTVAMVKVPDFIGEDEGPIIELLGASSRAIEAAGIETGNRVLIVGLGPSGLIMSQWAKNIGASRVYGWDLHSMRRTLGLKLGCDEAFDNSSKDIVDTCFSKIGEVDVIIDAFGSDLLVNAPTLDNALRLLKKGGRIVSYGHPRGRRTIDTFLFQRKRAVMCCPENDISKIRDYLNKGISYIREGKLDIKPLVTGNITLEEVEEGIKKVVTQPDKFLKIIVDIEK